MTSTPTSSDSRYRLPSRIFFSLDREAAPVMTVIYGNPRLGRRLDDRSVSYTREQVLAFVNELREGGAYLITTLPSGAGVDLHAEDDGTIWIEFYADDGLHSATVSPLLAERVFDRAYALDTMSDTKAQFADLIAEWNY